MKGVKTNWTHEWDEKLRKEFPIRFSRDIGDELGLSIRSIIRRARFLGLEKEEGFLDKNRDKITELATKARPENPTKGDKTFRIPGGEKYQYKKGNIPASNTDPKVRKKITESRNKTIESERVRIKYGLKQKTKLKLKP